IDSGGVWRGIAMLLLLIVLNTAIGILWQWWRRRLTPAGGEFADVAKALSSFRVFFVVAFATPLAVVLLGEALQVHVIGLTFALYAGVLSAALGQAVAVGVLAPDAPGRRLVAADDRTARALARCLAWSTQAVGWLLILLAASRAIAVPDSLAVAIKMLF